jgi:hypothetical protein
VLGKLLQKLDVGMHSYNLYNVSDQPFLQTAIKSSIPGTVSKRSLELAEPTADLDLPRPVWQSLDRNTRKLGRLLQARMLRIHVKVTL